MEKTEIFLQCILGANASWGLHVNIFECNKNWKYSSKFLASCKAASCFYSVNRLGWRIQLGSLVRNIWTHHPWTHRIKSQSTYLPCPLSANGTALVLVLEAHEPPFVFIRTSLFKFWSILFNVLGSIRTVSTLMLSLSSGFI